MTPWGESLIAQVQTETDACIGDTVGFPRNAVNSNGLIIEVETKKLITIVRHQAGRQPSEKHRRLTEVEHLASVDTSFRGGVPKTLKKLH